jgi:enoyl-CoA hydratase/carnithine racemase
VAGLVAADVDKDGVACITLNDPGARNALSVAMADELRPIIAELAGNASIRCVILTGAPPAFSAGGDLAMLESIRERTVGGELDAAAHMYAFYNDFLAVGRLPVPTIAAVNGHAVGAGLCIAMACDFMIVAAEAKVGVNFARLGLHPGMGASWWLSRRVGAARAAELLVTGRLIDGATAAQYGLALESCPGSAVLDRAQELAADVAASAPTVVRQLVAGLRDPQVRTLDQQLRVEAANQAENYLSADLLEGLRAARERRPARFTGE